MYVYVWHVGAVGEQGQIITGKNDHFSMIKLPKYLKCNVFICVCI